MVTVSGESAEAPPAGDRQSGTLSENVQIGRLEGLRSLRDVLAEEIENPPKQYATGSSTPALARQLRDVLKDIAEIEAMLPEDGSIVDELNERRDAARVAAAGDAAAAGDRR